MSEIRTILLVEDDNFIRDLSSKELTKAGYHVDTVVTGPSGLELANTGKYDLVLLDIMIPDMTGVDVLKALRGPKGDQLKGTKIIITTNLDQDSDSRSQLENLADGYLIKADVTPRKLVEVVKHIESFGTI